MMLQTIFRSGASIAGAESFHASVYATQQVAKFANPERKIRTPPRLIGGKWEAGFGITDPRFGDSPRCLLEEL